MLLGTSAIYLFKGWQSLLVTMGMGGFAVVAFALDTAGAGFGEGFAVYTALALAALSAGVLPAVRAHIHDGDFGEVEGFMAAVGFIAPVVGVAAGRRFAGARGRTGHLFVGTRPTFSSNLRYSLQGDRAAEATC